MKHEGPCEVCNYFSRKSEEKLYPFFFFFKINLFFSFSFQNKILPSCFQNVQDTTDKKENKKQINNTNKCTYGNKPNLSSLKSLIKKTRNKQIVQKLYLRQQTKPIILKKLQNHAQLLHAPPLSESDDPYTLQHRGQSAATVEVESIITSACLS